jgi:hypothetical protein
MNRARGVACAAIVVLACLAPSAARAADPRVQQDLEQAEQALVNLDYDGANKAAARLVQQRGLSHEQLVRAYRVLGVTDAVLDKESAAREAFQLLLTYDPTYVGDANLGPRVQGPFMEARGFLRAQPVQPGVETSVVIHAGETGTIRVTTRDPTHVARRVVVGYRWGAEGPFTTVQVAAGDGATANVPAPPVGTARLDYYAQVTDDHDSVAFESGSPTSPKSATVEAGAPAAVAPARGAAAGASEHHSIFASPIFWAVAAVVVAGGATGVYFATRPGSPAATAPTSATLTPKLDCGAGACN